MGCGTCGKLKGEKDFTVRCLCGLTRILPHGLKAGDEIHLDPCPKCGFALNGIFTGHSVKEVYDESNG